MYVYIYIYIYICMYMYIYMLLIDLSAGVAGKYNFVPIITTRSQRLSLAKGTASYGTNRDLNCI